jgi:small-conductance mechanosensitive channel
MKIEDKQDKNPRPAGKHTTLISVAVIFMFLCIILITGEMARLSGFDFIARHEKTIVNSELVIFTILFVEFIGRAIIEAFKRKGNEPAGHIRAILRGIAYIILAIGIVSSLSSNPGLAIGIGTVTGVIIAFATQNLVGNVFAGVMLAKL